jgi:hypothetical protein
MPGHPSLQGEGDGGAKISVIRNYTFDQACLTESLAYDYILCLEPQYKVLRLWSARYSYDLLICCFQWSFKTTLKLYAVLKTKLTHSGNLGIEQLSQHCFKYAGSKSLQPVQNTKHAVSRFYMRGGKGKCTVQHLSSAFLSAVINKETDVKRAD